MKSTTFISAVLASASLARAGVLKRDLVVQTLDNWSSLGCWSDSQSSRTLDVGIYFGDYVSDTDCQYKCQQAGYAYAGTEYSGQCYCSNTINAAAVQKPDSDCNMACSGDKTMPCGGPDRINLFQNVTTPRAPPSLVQSVDGWSEVACYTDLIQSRALAHQVDVPGGKWQVTVKTCVDACQAAGYSLAGVEYSNECYCDNAIQNNQSVAADQGSCNMACTGDKSQLCGGAGRMNLYSLGGATPAIAAPPAAVTPVQASLPAGWTTLGCYVDAVGQRTLGNYIGEPQGGMTTEYCVSTCAAQGYSIAGTEYGGECYCDNAVQNNHGLAADGNAGCNMQCHGNAGETCGGANRLNVYAAGPGWTQLGCYTDAVYSRTLAFKATYPGDLTVEKCQASCQASGYPYAGLEFGTECYCGASFDNGGAPAVDGCDFACAGNSNQICGGSPRLSVYAYIYSNGTI